MELELSRVDYTIVGITSSNCMRLLPQANPQETQKVSTNIINTNTFQLHVFVLRWHWPITMESYKSFLSKRKVYKSISRHYPVPGFPRCNLVVFPERLPIKFLFPPETKCAHTHEKGSCF